MENQTDLLPKEKKKRKSPRKRFVPVHIKTLPKKNKVIVLREVKYKNVVVEVGYKSDGLTKLVNKFPPDAIRAALVHDKVCSGCIDKLTGKRIPRKTGDKYFLELLELDGVSKFRRLRYYYAVSAYRILTFKK